MFYLYSGHELTEEQLVDFCEFDETDIAIANQTQIDFILVCYNEFDDIPYCIKRNLKNNMYTRIENESNTVFIFWH